MCIEESFDTIFNMSCVGGAYLAYGSRKSAMAVRVKMFKLALLTLKNSIKILHLDLYLIFILIVINYHIDHG